jgi:hypothetical protein
VLELGIVFVDFFPMSEGIPLNEAARPFSERVSIRQEVPEGAAVIRVYAVR